MTTKQRAASLTAQVHERLRSDILNGHYAAGSPLRLAPLSEQFDVSMSVIREALVRLTEQHLVVLAPNQGFRVVDISREDLMDLTDMRIMFEGIALRRSIENGDVNWEAKVLAAHHVLERAPMTRDDGPGTTDEWSAAHAAFHDSLGVACGSPRLLAMVRSLRDSSELYRQLSGAGRSGNDGDIAGEHQNLMELATSRKADEAVEALRLHFQHTTDTLLASVLAPDKVN